MKNIVFIAPPASGKGTQSKRMSDAYQIPHISIGDLLRKECASGTKEGKELQDKMQKGLLIDDETVTGLLLERLYMEDCQNGYILDGFPRNKKQANLYDEVIRKQDRKIELVILLDLDYETARNRIIGRIDCPKCGRVYNTEIEMQKPEVEGICDTCKTSLEKREDDNEKTFIRRFHTYEVETKPLIEYYQSKNILHRIDASRSVDEIYKDIVKILEEGTK